MIATNILNRSLVVVFVVLTPRFSVDTNSENEIDRKDSLYTIQTMWTICTMRTICEKFEKFNTPYV